MVPDPDPAQDSPASDQMSSTTGLTEAEAARRLEQYGPNTLPVALPPGLAAVFLRQFLSPLIYILLAATAVSFVLGDVKDAIFIGLVLLINGVIGTTQEYSANRAAAALRRLEQPQATVVRNGHRRQVESRLLVPGDIVLLESGDRVPADLRLLSATDLNCDESLLTGESAPVHKQAAAQREPGTIESVRLAFASTIVTRGRGRGLVEATGAGTRIGHIAASLSAPSLSHAPLIIRMERFARLIAIAVGIAIALLVMVGLLRDIGLREVFLLSVALAVSAIPEGLPVAISVALAIGMRRMARANVIVRNMAAVEALGSCTMIATDKTGTLTLNELTVTDLCLPDGTQLICEVGNDADACTIRTPDGDDALGRNRALALLRAAALANEADLVREDDGWHGSGDTVDIALLAVAQKGGLAHEDVGRRYPLLSRIPYEPQRKYAASFHNREEQIHAFVKGAPDTLIEMCDRMDTGGGATVPIDRRALLAQKEQLAAQGLRVLAFASGIIGPEPAGPFDHRHLVSLSFLGLAGMHDPVRAEVPAAIADCRRAGVDVVMITGDDPRTASTIAGRAGLAFEDDQVVTGDDVQRAESQGEAALDRLTRQARVYARVQPEQKLSIVLSLARSGHFVAVTGDGVNDAPALRHAHVGVAMGRRGTDVAKESADIVLTDDNFASIVEGIRQGRVAYANIRKVVFMLVSTGAAEVLLFLLALPLGLPMPLSAVQLLWLNLVTNGIQDVMLAGEGPEGDELALPPRRPREPLFDATMIRRVALSAAIMGGGGFALFYMLLQQGMSAAAASNSLLLLFVLFENFQTLNSRSERRSVFRGFWTNPMLLFGVAAAQALHIAAMHVPALRDTLGLQPVSLAEWALLLALAAVIVVAMEIEKLAARRRR
jgi:Ca2+-transporting ATPase